MERENSYMMGFRQGWNWDDWNAGDCSPFGWHYFTGVESRFHPLGCLGVVPYRSGLVSIRGPGMGDRIGERALRKCEKGAAHGKKAT